MGNVIQIRTNLLNPISSKAFELQTDRLLTISEGKITDINSASDADTSSLDLRDCLAVPGLIDLHVHLSQYRIRGHYSDSLLPWLEEVVFPEEEKSASYDFASELADEFISALYKAGTTTAVIYTAPYRSAGETAFEAAKHHNLRAFIGQTIMNQNCPDALKQADEQIMQDCETLLKNYHSPESGLQYILTPRFAPACSFGLMQKIGNFARENDLWIQTHLSENKDEIAWVQKLFGMNSYAEVYAQAGLLTPKTLLAHCIHLTERDYEMIEFCGSKIVHCPDSNFYLRSGQFPLAQVRKRELPFALGSDVGAGTSLNMLYHAKLYNYRQETEPVSPADAFYRITLGAAELLNLQHRIGSLEVGKDADLVFLKLPHLQNPLTESILSELIFTGHEWKIEQVYTKGLRKV